MSPEEIWIDEDYIPGLVSIIIPSYNRVNVIVETLDSVYAQIYRPIELIIVDDGSTDGTEVIVSKWIDIHNCSDFNIKFIKQHNLGAPIARNKGANLSKGEFIQFFDSDDIMLPEKIEKSVHLMEREISMFVAVNCAKFRGNTDNIIEISNFAERSFSIGVHSFLIHAHINTQSPLYTRKALREIGPWCEKLTIWQDTEFCYRVIGKGIKGVWIPEILVLLRDSPISIMNRKIIHSFKCKLTATEVIEEDAKKMGIYDEELLNINGRILATISRNLAMEGYWVESSYIFREAIKRMNLKNRTIHMVHRLVMKILGTEIMKKLGYM